MVKMLRDARNGEGAGGPDRVPDFAVIIQNAEFPTSLESATASNGNRKQLTPSLQAVFLAQVMHHAVKSGCV